MGSVSPSPEHPDQRVTRVFGHHPVSALHSSTLPMVGSNYCPSEVLWDYKSCHFLRELTKNSVVLLAVFDA